MTPDGRVFGADAGIDVGDDVHWRRIQFREQLDRLARFLERNPAAEWVGPTDREHSYSTAKRAIADLFDLAGVLWPR